MFARQSILIIEDEPLIAMDLAAQIEVLDGRVVGPVSSVSDALTLLDEEAVNAAIVDAKLTDRDITPVGLVLVERGIPFVVHSGGGIPAALKLALPSLRLVLKPAPARVVIAQLLATMAGD